MHTVSSSRCYIEIVAYATNRPSLSRSGGRLFTVACLGLHGSFPDDDRHGILSYVEGETHTHHLLSEGWNQPPACLLFTLHRPLSGDFYFTCFVRFCQFMPRLTKRPGVSIITVKSKPRTRLAPQAKNKRCGKATKPAVTCAEWRQIFYRAVSLPSWKFSGR